MKHSLYEVHDFAPLLESASIKKPKIKYENLKTMNKPPHDLAVNRSSLRGYFQNMAVQLILLALIVAFSPVTAIAQNESGTSSELGLSSSADSSGGGLLGGLGGLIGGSDGNELLSPDRAFVIESSPASEGNLTFNWAIEEGYYLYRDKFSFKLADDQSLELGTRIESSDITRGKMKADEFFGDVEVNRKFASANLVLANSGPLREALIDVTYQGCADIGVCFPPQTTQMKVKLGSASYVNSSTAALATKTNNTTSIDTTNNSTVPNTSVMELSRQDQLAKKLGSSSLPVVLGLFFGLGLLLALTPCVFPMIPILSGLIIGQGDQITTRKSLTLSVIYVLAMALTYTVIGVFVGLSGENIQAWLQNAWILSAFALLLVVLALSMFGFYEFQMPLFVQEKLNRISNNQKSGTYAGAAVMGFLSALIVGPCVTAPLVGALIFIADTGDAVVGGLALFSLSIGMGVPLIIIGASAGKFMPRAGAWMDTIKAAFGVMMLALAIWMLSRFLSPVVILILSACLTIITGVYLGAFDALEKAASGWRRFFKGTGLVLVLYGVALFIGAMAGSKSLLQPLQGFGSASSISSSNGVSSGQVAVHGNELEFAPLKGTAELQTMLAAAASEGKPFILDFYADWCVSCKEMEAFTFTDEQVIAKMSRANLARTDVTKNDKADRDLLKEFGLFGPPAILFFGPDGKEVRNARVVGFMNKGDFSDHLDKVYSNMGQLSASL